jgi:hypothetical protein
VISLEIMTKNRKVLTKNNFFYRGCSLAMPVVDKKLDFDKKKK